MAKKKTQSPKPASPRIANRRARHDYHILEVVECGLQLIDEAYARVRNGEALLVGATIAAYPQAAAGMQHEPTRDRKLLLHRRQVGQLETHVKQKGKTLIPLAVYFRRGWAKCELGIAVGKKQYDKRQAIRRRQQQRDIDREIRRRQRR